MVGSSLLIIQSWARIYKTPVAPNVQHLFKKVLQIEDIVAQREQCLKKSGRNFDNKIGFFAHFEKQGSIYGE